MSGTLQEKAKAEKTRQVFTYKVPKRMANGVVSIGMVELSVQEELMAAKRAAGDTHRLAYELAMQSLCEINGQPVGVADGSADKAFDEMGPKMRQLVMQAYVKIHGAEDSDSSDFLKSQEIRVG